MGDYLLLKWSIGEVWEVDCAPVVRGNIWLFGRGTYMVDNILYWIFKNPGNSFFLALGR